MAQDIKQFEHIIKELYSKEGRSISYISRLIEIDRGIISRYLKENNIKPAERKRRLLPSNQKFLNKHKQMIKSRLDKDVAMTDIAKELGVNENYLIGTIIKCDNTLTKALKDKNKRLADKAEQRRQEKAQSRAERIESLKFQDLDGEEWKEILGFPEYYISNMGRIKHWVKEYQMFRLIKFMTNKNTGRYYWRNKKGAYNVARLVGHHFIEGYSEENNTIEHVNNDYTDNRASNLKWVSQAENNRLAYEKGRVVNRAHSRYKFKKIILDDKYEFSTIVALAKFLGLSETQTRRHIDGHVPTSTHTFKFIN